MAQRTYDNYVKLGICPGIDEENDELRFSQANVDFIIDKYLKLQKQFDELKAKQEANDDLNYYQFNMARADVEYYKTKCKYLEEQLKDLRSLNRRYDKFQEVNAGLKRECRRYKDQVQGYEQKMGQMQEKIKELIEENDANIELKRMWIEKSRELEEKKNDSRRS